MSLLIHDTLQRKKVEFAPRDPARVTLYVCGPTVYSYAHIGNARPVVVFDVLFRLLRRLYGEEAVVYARNVTDVDDKINAAAAAAGTPISAVTDKYLAIYEADMAALGALPPTLQPRATAHIAPMLDQIGRLVAAGAAYAAEGHVLFRVRAFEDYGRLSGRSLDDMVAGARVEVAPYKEDPADFVLWKPSKPGEPSWPSPWGEGRPGWHIECSAMMESQLGLPVDIHGGGHDLIFPHHENELAQGVCATGGGEYARYWMHNGFLTLDSEKMSKSAGGTLRVHDLLKTAPGEALRWALLSAHYRAPLEWTAELVAQSKRTLDGLYGVLLRAKDVEARPIGGVASDPVRPNAPQPLEDDLNTPAALARLSALAKELDGCIRDGAQGRVAIAARDAKHRLSSLAADLGVLQQEPEAWFAGGADDALKARVDALIAARGEARAAKDWPAADRIRAELAELGVEVLDGAGGTATWRMRD